MPDESYSAFPFGPKFPLIVLGFMALIDVVSIGSGESSLWFNIIWTFGLVYVAYLLTWVIVSELTIVDENLTWRTAPHCARDKCEYCMFVGSVLVVCSSKSSEIIEMDNGESLRVFGGARFSAFCEDLHRRRPELPIQLSLNTRLQSGFRSRRRPPP
jgi:hypothetical protein